ncbi:P-type DNA transfer protein VirB5 [Acinetobacter variabilis]|uniref:P-type DNA transfer protein VirB5 n=1 Tax=Acinetobacter variabilis TaxID=70346 RepID=UPI0028A806F1|nr:P-type DNA transfer protein VirB5 [Acinetobacter variabilis]
MKKNFRMIMLVGTLMVQQANATGIPVFDAASMTNALNTIVQLKQQLDQIKSLQSQFEGVRTMGSLLNRPELRNMLPTDWQNVYDSVKSGSISGISGAYGDLSRQESVTGTTDELKKLRERRWEQSLSDKVMGENAYRAAIDRLNNLEELGKKINTTQDAKAAIDFMSRMQQEQALVQNEAARMQLMSQLQLAEERLNTQKEEKIQKALWDVNKPMPRF